MSWPPESFPAVKNSFRKFISRSAVDSESEYYDSYIYRNSTVERENSFTKITVKRI